MVSFDEERRHFRQAERGGQLQYREADRCGEEHLVTHHLLQHIRFIDRHHGGRVRQAAAQRARLACSCKGSLRIPFIPLISPTSAIFAVGVGLF